LKLRIFLKYFNNWGQSRINFSEIEVATQKRITALVEGRPKKATKL
jgi:hypothetical protein